jgi:signal transduction histidine kinase
VKKSKAWSLNARITTLCLPVVALLLLLSAVAALAANRNNDQTNLLVNDIGTLRTDSQELEIALLNQETGIRGYAISGARADLQPYTDGLTTQQTLLADMHKRLTGRPKIAEDLTNLESAIDRWHTNVAMPVIKAIEAGDRRTALAVIDPSARGQFDDVRAATDVLLTDVLSMRHDIVSHIKRTGSVVLWTLIESAVVIILAGFVLAVLLKRMVTRPVAHLAGDIRQVAAGDYNHTIDASGPPELAALGSDVEDMRRRIVADLRLVQSASQAVEQANAQLERQAADLQRSNQDLEQFAYVASHDLQEPLRKVASFCQLLQRRYAGQLDERADQYISFAVDGAHRMQRLINDLLAFSRIGRATTGFTDVDLNAVVAAAVSANDDGIERAAGEIAYDALPTAQGEEALLQALFANLISNSVKFRAPSRPLRVKISAERVADDWQITCSDNGIGIEAEYADKVFVIFQRLHAKDVYPGTGIGLAVAKRIVEYHGGRIWIETSAEQGATICFTLPAVTPSAPQQDVPTSGRAAIGEAVKRPVDA